MKARIEKNTPAIEIYSYIIGQVTLKNKNPSDNEIFAVIKSYINNIKKVTTSNKEYNDKCIYEITELENFLPTQLSDIEISSIITSINNNSEFKNVVKYFTDFHSGTYNPGDLRNVWLKLMGK